MTDTLYDQSNLEILRILRKIIAMSDTLSRLHAILIDEILPHLNQIELSQAEQRRHTEQLGHNINDFRAEMQLRFAELRAEIAYCRQEVEDVMVSLRDTDSPSDAEPVVVFKKTQIH
jgi:hypothetical protein